MVNMMFKIIVRFAMAFMCCAVWAAEVTLDLRTAVDGGQRIARPARLASGGQWGDGSAEEGVLRTTALPARAAAVRDLEVGDVLDVILFDGVEAKIRITEQTESPLGGRTFLGEVLGGGVKNAVVLQTEEGITVDIDDFNNSHVYSVVSSSDGVAVKEIDTKAVAVAPTDPVDPGLPKVGAGKTALRTAAMRLGSDQASTLVDMLVAYDASAAQWARQNGGGITNFATVSVQKMNAVLANTGLASLFRFRLVGVIALDVNGGNDLNGVLDAVQAGNGAWAPVKAKRDEVGADVVTTLIDTGSAGGNTGLGFSLRDTDFQGFSEHPYNVCAVRAVAISHTMTHEVGHNLGAGHATAVNAASQSPGPQLFSYSAGHYFTGTNGVAYHTIMAYNSDGYGNMYESAPFFSSPEYEFMGVPTGDTSHNNTRTLRETFLAASRWRTQVIPMSYDVYFSPASGTLFDGSITVVLTPGSSGAAIRYTLDGSTPTIASPLYTGPITLYATTTIRAATVEDGAVGPAFEAVYYLRDLGTAVDAPQLAWTTSTTHPWEYQITDTYDGMAAAQSYDDGEFWGGESWMEASVTGPTSMSFRYKTIKYRGKFSVSIDGETAFGDTADSQGRTWILSEVEVPAGTHVVRFSYQSLGGRYGGFNGAWLDTIKFDALSRAPSISPQTTGDEATATTFQGVQEVMITPPVGRDGTIYYTLDGSDPTGENALVYSGTLVLTRSTRVRAVFVEGGKDPSVEVGGLYLERHPVQPGEWTTDVAGARSAAAQNGRLIAVLAASRETCWWSQQFYKVAESPAFLAWAKMNGIYLITGDTSCNADAETANRYFWTLHSSLYGNEGTYYPTIIFVLPSAPDNPVGGKGIARNDGDSRVGTEKFLGTADSLAAGFASVLGVGMPSAPVCSLSDALVDSYPTYFTLTHANTAGTIYYTLDGSPPTPTNGIRYQDGTTIEVSNSAVMFAAAVWMEGATGSPLSSPVIFASFKTIGDLLGTEGVAWSRSGDVIWHEDDDHPGSLRTGGLMNGEYVSRLVANVSGGGKLVFSYEANVHSWQNVFAFIVNGSRQFNLAWNGETSHYVGMVTNEVVEGMTTEFKWVYTVEDGNYDFDDHYVTRSGVRIYDVQWIPNTPAKPAWAADADDAKFAAWAALHAVNVDLFESGADYSAQYLLNVDATASVSLAVVSASVVEGGFSVRVRAFVGGTAVDLASINGRIRISAGTSPGALTRRTISSADISLSGGDATIFVPVSQGSFVRVEIDN
jgi:hypothetical protein